MDQIIMSDTYDGYTVRMTREQRDRVMEVHTRRRRNFHLTMEIAVLIYKEVGRRFGVSSEEYQGMQRLHNQHMIDVDHPRMSGVRIQVPGKIFRALMLLDIFIPNWAICGF